MGNTGDYDGDCCKAEKPVETPFRKTDDIKGIVLAIILLASLGILTKQNSDRVIDDCTHILEDFIGRNFVRLN